MSNQESTERDESKETDAPATEPTGASAEPTAQAESSAREETPAVESQAPEEGASDDADDAAEAGEAEAADGEGEKGPKKKRRRRKKKGKKPEGEGAAAQEKSAGAFAAFFEGGERKHAFGAGEIVAGSVVRVEDGVAFVDLFGKALAVMDAFEPAEIAEIEAEHETEEESEAAAQEEAEAAAAAEAEVSEETTEAEASEESAAPAESPEAPASEAQEEQEEHDEDESSAGTVAAVELPPEVAEYQLPPLAETSPAVGSIFRGRVVSVSESGHVAILNRKVEKPLVKARLRALRGQKASVTGLVFGFNRGGFDVLVDGVRCFCPASGMSFEPIEDPNQFVGKKLEFTLPPAKGSGRSLVVTRRALLERERRRAVRERFKTLEVGQRFEGRVVDVKDFGVVVDIGGGVEGLVHASELSWNRGVKPSDEVKRGDVVQVEVIEVRPITRKERHGKLSLSVKRCLPDPWAAHADIIKEGHFQIVKVVRTTEFGAFCELAPGIDGLLHVSELGGRDVKHAKQAVKVGDEIAVLVDRVDPKQRRISLSKLSPAEAEKLKAGELEPGSLKRPPKQGDHITVVIERVEHHGVLVQVEGVLGKRGRGYISNRELGGGEAKKNLVPGAKLDVKVVGVDRDGGLKCSVRAKEVDEERKAVKDYRRETSRQGFGTLADLLREKLGQKGD